jgi:hypothetical protein
MLARLSVALCVIAPCLVDFVAGFTPSPLSMSKPPRLHSPVRSTHLATSDRPLHFRLLPPTLFRNPQGYGCLLSAWSRMHRRQPRWRRRIVRDAVVPQALP